MAPMPKCYCSSNLLEMSANQPLRHALVCSLTRVEMVAAVQGKLSYFFDGKLFLL